MRSFSGTARTLTPLLALGALFSGASLVEAQNFGNGSNPYSFNNQTYSYGLQLPQVPQPNGQDEIRAADGTTCRSSMASNNAYLDVGGIGGQGADGSFDSGTVYGRMIIPLGGVPDRLDCSSLYNLEILRLQHELALMRSGMNGSGPSVGSIAPAGKRDKAWAEEGWNNKGWKASSKSGGPASAQASAADRIPAATVVPMRLQPQGSITGTGDTANYDPRAQFANVQAAVEILPWSNEPAQGARVLTGIATKKKPKPSDNFFAD